MKLCSHFDCDRKVQARGLCNTHYKRWQRSTPVKPVVYTARDLVLMSLPGTIREIAASSGLCYDVARVTLRTLHAEGLVHIEDWREPRLTKCRWLEVFGAGPGEDATVSRRQRYEYSKRLDRESHARRKLVTTRHGWASALGVPA